MDKRWKVIVAFMMVSWACSDSHDANPEPTTGALTITVTTTGDTPDPDGYLLGLDDATAVAINVNEQTTHDDVEQGPHTVALSGLAGNCIVAGDNPRVVTVAANETVTTVFEVTCTRPPCGLRAAGVVTMYRNEWTAMVSTLPTASGCLRARASRVI